MIAALEAHGNRLALLMQNAVDGAFAYTRRIARKAPIVTLVSSSLVITLFVLDVALAYFGVLKPTTFLLATPVILVAIFFFAGAMDILFPPKGPGGGPKGREGIPVKKVAKVTNLDAYRAARVRKNPSRPVPFLRNKNYYFN